MNLKKMFTTAIAVMMSAVAFAGNSYTEAQQAALKDYTTAAVTLYAQDFSARLEANNLNASDKQIAAIADKDIAEPLKLFATLFNKEANGQTITQSESDDLDSKMEQFDAGSTEIANIIIASIDYNETNKTLRELKKQQIQSFGVRVNGEVELEVELSADNINKDIVYMSSASVALAYLVHKKTLTEEEAGIISGVILYNMTAAMMEEAGMNLGY